MSIPRPLPPPSGPDIRVTHVRASLLRGMQLVAEAKGGTGAWEALLEGLGPETRDALHQGLDSFRWIETPHLNAVAIAHEARFGPEAVGERVLAAVREQLKGSHPGILLILDAEGLVRQTPTLCGFYFRGGRVDVEEVGQGRALISVFAEGLFPSGYTTSIPTFLCGAVSLAGGSHTEFSHHPPVVGHRHRYELRWQEG